ncbi:MAG: methyltransferase domain-containing protein [Romboutsia sp.]
MHANSYKHMSQFIDRYLKDKVNDKLKILDLGSQDVNGTYKPLFNNSNWQYTGCDMCSGPNVDIVLKDVYNWKEIESNSIDVLVAGQVFEHAEYIWNTIMEITRVMKEDAVCCIIAPAVWVEHKYPLDCWRIFSDGFRALAKFAGLQVLEAYTDWGPYGANMSDSILICKKPILEESEKQKLGEKIKIMKSLADNYEIKI